MNIYIHETAKANVPSSGLDVQVKVLAIVELFHRCSATARRNVRLSWMLAVQWMQAYDSTIGQKFQCYLKPIGSPKDFSLRDLARRAL